MNGVKTVKNIFKSFLTYMINEKERRFEKKLCWNISSQEKYFMEWQRLKTRKTVVKTDTSAENQY